MAIRRFRNQHASQERTKRQRQAKVLSKRCHTQNNQQQIEHEQLLWAQLSNQLKPMTHQALANKEN